MVWGRSALWKVCKGFSVPLQIFRGSLQWGEVCNITTEANVLNIVLLLVIRFMADLLRKYRGSVVIMVGRGGAEPHYVHN